MLNRTISVKLQYLKPFNEWAIAHLKIMLPTNYSFKNLCIQYKYIFLLLFLSSFYYRNPRIYLSISVHHSLCPCLCLSVCLSLSLSVAYPLLVADSLFILSFSWLSVYIERGTFLLSDFQPPRLDIKNGRLQTLKSVMITFFKLLNRLP